MKEQPDRMILDEAKYVITICENFLRQLRINITSINQFVYFNITTLKTKETTDIHIVLSTRLNKKICKVALKIFWIKFALKFFLTYFILSHLTGKFISDIVFEQPRGQMKLKWSSQQS